MNQTLNTDYQNYGVQETNPLPKGYHEAVTDKIKRTVYWKTPGLRITRLRLLSDPGFPIWDVSYCTGFIGDEPVGVSLPFCQLSKRGWKKDIVNYAKKDGVFAKGIGILTNVSTLC